MTDVNRLIGFMAIMQVPFMHDPDALMYIEEVKTVLKEYQALQPRVLTREEMTELGKSGGAVYIEESPKGADVNCLWALVTAGVEPPKDRGYNYPGGVDFNAVGEMGEIWDGDMYGLNTPLGWRAWNTKPTDEQREATPWDA